MQIRGRGNAFATGIGNWAVNVLFSQVMLIFSPYDLLS